MTAHGAARAAGKIAINVAIPISAVIASIGWVANHGIDIFDIRYAKAQEFTEYRAAQRYQHSLDSLVYVDELKEIRRDIKALLADCQKRGGCP